MTNLDAMLWTDRERRRYFIIPDAAALAPGDLALHTLTGRAIRVEPTAAAAFEVDEAGATAWLKNEFGKLLDTTRAAADRFIERLKRAADDPGAS
jgi:hypothetical protein